MNHYVITVVLTFYGYDVTDALTTLDTTYVRCKMYAISYVNDAAKIDNMVEALKNSLLRDFSAQKHGKIEGFRVHIF